MTNRNDKNKTKTTTTIISALVIGLVLLSPSTILPNVHATGELTRECIAHANQDAFKKVSMIDERKAVSLATSDNEFSSRTVNHQVKYGGLSEIWNIDSSSCTSNLKSVNVVYYITDSQGHEQNLIFNEDAGLTKINIVSQTDAYRYNIGSLNAQTWSGYNMAGNSNNSTMVYQAYAQYTVPTPSQPSGFLCYDPICDVAVWTGLMNAWDGSNQNLVQDGTDSQVSCNSSGGSCTNSYSMWYEALPANSTPCTGATVNAGDTITATVTNEALNSGPSSSYDFSIVDSSQNPQQSCTHTVTSYGMTTPTFSSYIDERGYDVTNKKTMDLASFPNNSITGDMNLGSGSQSIYNSYSNGYYALYTMQNCSPYTNVYAGSVGSTGSFTQYYVQSTCA